MHLKQRGGGFAKMLEVCLVSKYLMPVISELDLHEICNPKNYVNVRL